VLQPTWVPGIYRLWFRAVKGDGTRNQGWIFIRDKSNTGLPATMPDYPPGCNQIWKFTRRGNRLDCAPSVNWVSWGFHNAGNWSTEYVEMPVAERSMSKAGDDEGPEPPRIHFGSAVHSDINNSDQESSQRLIKELKQKGILL
jgi:hypothetical protein